jgi:hypothetical protein
MSVYHDSELMQQVVTSSPLTDTADFHAVRDEHSDPMLFSIGTDGVIYVTKKDDLGRNQLLNLSQSFGLPLQHKATALGVYQKDDLSLRLTFAHGDGTEASILVVTKTMRPQDLLTLKENIAACVLSGEVVSYQIYGLLMVC